MSVAVVGSMNQDIIVRVPRHPRAGETVLGRDHATAFGGKGANQAVAAATLGAEVAFFGRVGDDGPGREMVAAMAGRGIDTSGVGVDPQARTGLAIITLDDAAENAIIVSAGANARFLPEYLDGAAAVLDRAEVTLLQLEIPLETAMHAASLAGHRVVLNPAPARDLPAELLTVVDVLVPNQTELGLLAGVAEPRSVDASLEAARRIEGPGAVVVTLGAEGALVVVGGSWEHVPAPAVTPVDTTGAGDAFCGALAEALARGVSLTDAVERAVTAGALATTRLGAQSALPTRAELDRLMASR
jgi:ribokinase